MSHLPERHWFPISFKRSKLVEPRVDNESEYLTSLTVYGAVMFCVCVVKAFCEASSRCF